MGDESAAESTTEASATPGSDTDMKADLRTSTVTALIVHPCTAEQATLRDMLGGGEQVRVIAVTGDGDEAVALAHRLNPAVTLLDDQVAAPSDGDLVLALAGRSRVIIMTGATDHRAITSLLRAPVRGCLVHEQFDASDLLGAVRAVAAGLGWLSPVAVAAVSWALRNAHSLDVGLVPDDEPEVPSSDRRTASHGTSSSTVSRNPRAARRA